MPRRLQWSERRPVFWTYPTADKPVLPVDGIVRRGLRQRRLQPSRHRQGRAWWLGARPSRRIQPALRYPDQFAKAEGVEMPGPVIKFLAKDIMAWDQAFDDDAFAGGRVPGWETWLAERREKGILDGLEAMGLAWSTWHRFSSSAQVLCI